VQGLNAVYTQRFNRKYQRVGYLYQGCYKAILVDKGSYLLELCRYVVLNPVRANMVKRSFDWRWSGYLVMMGQLVVFSGLVIDAILLQFGRQRSQAMKRFEAFVYQRG